MLWPFPYFCPLTTTASHFLPALLVKRTLFREQLRLANVKTARDSSKTSSPTLHASFDSSAPQKEFNWLSAYSSVSVAFVSLESKQSAFQLDSLAASVLFDDVSRLDDVTVSLRPPSGVSVSSIPLLRNRCFGCLLNASSSISFFFLTMLCPKFPLLDVDRECSNRKAR